jgi:rsbT co-antagonist protein RsbR
MKEERSLINSIAQRLSEAVERKQAEEEIRSLNEKLERRVVEQERSILELSTPVVKLWDEIVLLPLIGVVDTARAQQMIESLLAAIVRANARVVVLDITGVPSVDTSVAQHLIKSVAAAKMLGAEVIVTGVSPEAAQTLVKLCVDLSSMRTRGSLRAGLAEALSLTGRRVTSL